MASIIRLDDPKDSTKGTHGWQVRGAGKIGYHSKLFSDRKLGGREEALDEAKAYLLSYIKEHPNEPVLSSQAQNMFPDGFWRGGRLRTDNKSGTNGVFRTHEYARFDKERKQKLYYWAASHSIDKFGNTKTPRHQKFHVGTYGEELARELAIEFRRGWEAAALQGTKAVVRFFENF